MIKLVQMQSTRWVWHEIDDATGKVVRVGDHTFPTAAECLSHIERHVRPRIEASGIGGGTEILDLHEQKTVAVLRPEDAGQIGE